MSVSGSLLSLMLLDPIGAYLAVTDAMHLAGEDLGKAERELAAITERLKTVAGQLVYAQRQRDALMALVEKRVGIIEPLANCDCMDCATLREAREIIESSEAKLKSDPDGG